MPKARPQLAKLTRPRLHQAVPRERLFRLLDEGRERPLVWVSGPPGAGKTTLVASWLDVRELPGIWYQVDAGDADLPTFFHYLGQAAALFTRKGQRPLPALTPEYLQDVTGFGRRFFRELFSRLPSVSTLVLDNYQEVAPESFFHELIAQIVNEIAPRVTLIAVSRRDPPECYARQIANRSLQLVEAKDLKLTLDEALAICAGRVETDAGKIAGLHAQSEGWTAGFILLTERLRHGDTLPEAVEAESLRDVFNYFAGELFDRMPKATQRLLLCLGYLPRSTERAAKQLTGSDDAGSLLDDLHRRHLFVDQRMVPEPVYQFHTLFRAFLQHRSAESLTLPEQMDLTRRAAEILEQSGQTEDALEFYRKVGDLQAVQRIVLREAASLIERGRWQVVAAWAGSLPAGVINESCWLLYWLGMATASVAPAEARATLELAYQAGLRAEDRLCQAQAVAALIHTYVLEYAQFRPMDPWIERLLALLDGGISFSDTDAELRTYAALLAALTYRKPDHRGIEAYAQRVYELLSSASDVNLRLTATAYLLSWGATTGAIEFAARARPALESCLQQPGVTALNAAWSWFRLSWYHSLMGNYPECHAAMAKVAGLGEDEGLLLVRKFEALSGAWVEMHACNVEAAQRWSRRLDEVINPAHLMDRASSEGVKAWLAVLRGEPRAALAHTRYAVDFFDQAGSIHHQTNYRLAGVWAHILLRDYDGARRWIGEMRGFADRVKSLWQEIALRATEAHIALECGDRATAEERLRAAFGLSRERGQDHALGQHMRPWMPRLSAAALERGIEVDYVRRLIRRFAWPAPPGSSEHWPWAVKVYTLGESRLLVDDKPVVFGRKTPRKPVALLKALIAFGVQGVPEQKVMEAVWPEEEGDAAYRSFGLALHRLRRLLGSSDTVRLANQRASLDPTLVWTDASAFEYALERAEHEDSDPQTALALYRGSFLAGEEDAPWMVSLRERLRAKFVHHVSLLAHRLENERRWDSAVAWYLRGVDADDLTEEFYQGLIRCYVAQGRRAEALSVFRRLRHTLSVTLGLNPSAASEALVRGLQVG